MYAIVSIAGQQFKVEQGKKVFVHRLQGEVGESVSFDQVLLLSKDEKILVGAPFVQDAFVQAQIVSHNRGDKVLVFKKKRRKSYQKLNGHRQDFTQILIEAISETGAPKKAEPRKQAAPKAEPVAVVAAEVTAEVAAEPEVTKVAPKKAAPKATSTETKKAAPKKATEEKAKPAAKKAPAKAKGKTKSE
jgi:large subunit ribosomal protein L21